MAPSRPRPPCVRGRDRRDAAAGRVVAEMHEWPAPRSAPASPPASSTPGREVLERRGATVELPRLRRLPGRDLRLVNDEVVHGIPGTRRLEEGDIVSIDCGAVVDGWHGDAAFTVGVGGDRPANARLIEVGAGARSSRDRGHASGGARSATSATPWRRWCEAGVLGGRGVHAATASAGPCTRPRRARTPGPRQGRPSAGRCHAMSRWCAPVGRLRRGGRLDDGWTVVTADGRWAAHVEHTVAITDDGPRDPHPP
jgi:methionyl aminopeptidase